MVPPPPPPTPPSSPAAPVDSAQGGQQPAIATAAAGDDDGVGGLVLVSRLHVSDAQTISMGASKGENQGRGEMEPEKDGKGKGEGGGEGRGEGEAPLAWFEKKHASPAAATPASTAGYGASSPVSDLTAPSLSMPLLPTAKHHASSPRGSTKTATAVDIAASTATNTTVPPSKGIDVAALDALSDDEIVDAFTATRQMRKLARNFKDTCGSCRGPLLAQHRGWYTNHTRVLVIDGTGALWNGLGNNMNRWGGLFKLAEMLQWAVYIDQGGCGPGSGRAFDPDPETGCRFDPAAYFHGDGFDWRWHPAREKEFNTVMMEKGKSLHTFFHTCKKDRENARFRPCQITVDRFVNRKRSAVIQASAVVSNEYTIKKGISPGVTDGDQSQNDRWLHEWFASTAVQDMAYVKLKIRSPYDLQNEVIKSEHELGDQCAGTLSKYSDVTGDSPSPFSDAHCRMQHFFKPRPAVQRELLKLLLPMQSWDAMVAMHVRTGFADFQTEWVRHVMPSVSPPALAEMEAQFPCGSEDIVRGLGQVFEQCATDYSNQICSHWWEVPADLQVQIDSGSASRRGPNIKDGIERCFTCSWCPNTVPKEEREDLIYATETTGDGALATGVTCASRLAAHIAVDESLQQIDRGRGAPLHTSLHTARREAAGQAKHRWGLYILGDSPAMIKAFAHDPRLAGHVVHQSDEDVVGVTMSQVICNEQQVCTGVVDVPKDEEANVWEHTTGKLQSKASAAMNERGYTTGKQLEEEDQKGGLGYNRGWMRAVVDMYMVGFKIDGTGAGV